MKKIILILTVILLLFNSLLKAENINSKFASANELYKKGKYSEAISGYLDISNDGYKSAELYYNIGNSYFKMEKVPDAILFYERAKKLAPDDEDINFNLKIANLKIVDKINTVPKIFFMEWYENLHSTFSSSSWSTLSIIFIWLTFIFLSGYFLIWNIGMRKISFFSASASLIIAIACIFFAFEQSGIELSKNSAIVLSPSVYIKSSPDKTSTDLFILHEGTKVTILDQVGDWKKIKIADGNVGWLPIKTIEII
jgi:tetratricopeptide (TPR) repeat protein